MFAQPTITTTLLAGLALLATGVSARTWAGPIDMIEACHLQYGDNFSAQLQGSGSGDWYCSNGGGIKYPINVDAYCFNKFKDGAYADPQGGGAYDWGCYWR